MRRSLAVVVTVVLAVALGGCGDDPGSEASAGNSVLRIGYQRFGGLSLVKARGDAPGVTWSLFESGPALTEALKAGAIDLGQTGEAPPIFAAAARTQFVIAGVGAPSPRSEAVLVKAAKGYKSFADLKGRTVALNKGSNVHWLLLKLLEANKMTLSDINVKYLKPAEGRPAFDNDQVDAWVIWDPYFALAEQPGVQVLADATGVANNREYLLVGKDAASAKTEQIKSFLQTYEKTTAWGIEHPDERAEVLAPELKIDEPTTERALARAAQPVDQLNASIGDELQAIADGFAELELIPGQVDVKSLVDPRFAEAAP
ncbi:aliphatic sulfonate ABC transporter substrate-binding protein [Actinoplanes sp. TRM 88003]|uniref:Aliphatic sulfonate ABC transporter substrate-binding protein n=1 Tax=Paractinoplanes aksuensis TaxID=2939490 RepID=A0ABT1DYE1_9ACTN|nr:aliphatic sulfonate ABC transporter substrate-binding protein [Actinoplanes aksuensis]MCO8275896.1 aliphatic sulfonate ABC transporter substrate-binding protein [Actinoplanes aksuensis]